jgi:hypothetical protein
MAILKQLIGAAIIPTVSVIRGGLVPPGSPPGFADLLGAMAPVVGDGRSRDNALRVVLRDSMPGAWPDQPFPTSVGSDTGPLHCEKNEPPMTGREREIAAAHPGQSLARTPHGVPAASAHSQRKRPFP